MFIAREAAGLEHDAAKTTGSILLMLNVRAYKCDLLLTKNVFSMTFLEILVNRYKTIHYTCPGP